MTWVTGLTSPVKLAGLDVSLSDLECTTRLTRPPRVVDDDMAVQSWQTAPVRWEPLQVDIWQGGLERFNPTFVGVECIVATEVCVSRFSCACQSRVSSRGYTSQKSRAC